MDGWIPLSGIQWFEVIASVFTELDGMWFFWPFVGGFSGFLLFVGMGGGVVEGMAGFSS